MKRDYRFVEQRYMVARYPHRNNIESYKVFVPESNGSGAIGEVLSTPLIGTPLMSATPTFISIGNFDNQDEAEHLLKYIKTKLVRTLLGILKKHSTIQYQRGHMYPFKILPTIQTSIGLNQYQRLINNFMPNMAYQKKKSTLLNKM